MKTIRFDDSLPLMAEVIRAELGEEALNAGTILRDAVGCLSFFAAVPFAEAINDKLSLKLREALGAYARKDLRLAADAPIDMPDLFRIAAKLLKKGGTAPL